MLKYEEFLAESLAAEVKAEPKTAASKEARKLGLTYMGFGRYADRKGKLAYVVHNDKLVPYKSAYDLDDMYYKAKTAPVSKPVAKKSLTANQKPDKATQLKQEYDFHSSVYKNRLKQDNEILSQKNKEAKVLGNELSKFYNPTMFDENELTALRDYTGDMFGPINRYLYMGHDDDAESFDPEQIEEYVDAIDSAFDETQAPFSYTVYSGLSSRYSPDKIKPGGEYIFRGFVSTSLSYNVAINGFSDTGDNDTPVVLQIEISKGQKSIYLDPLSEHQGESETLLPRGSKIKVISGPHIMDDSIFSQEPEGTRIHLFHCTLIEDQ